MILLRKLRDSKTKRGNRVPAPIANSSVVPGNLCFPDHGGEDSNAQAHEIASTWLPRLVRWRIS